MYCKNCGAQINDDAKTCSACGAAVESTSAPVPATTSAPALNAQVTSIVAYITWVGLLIAFLAGDREGAKFHLNQALVVALFSLLGFIPFVGFIWSIFMAVCWVMGLVYAIQQQPKEVPLIGRIHLLK